jgi:hypothetical protein
VQSASSGCGGGCGGRSEKLRMLESSYWKAWPAGAGPFAFPYLMSSVPAEESRGGNICREQLERCEWPISPGAAN